MCDVLLLVELTRVDPAMHIFLTTLRIQMFKNKTRMTRMMRTQEAEDHDHDHDHDEIETIITYLSKDDL